MNEKSTLGTNKISQSRKVLFNLIIALFPILIVIILELLLRLFGYGNNLSLFIDNPDKAYKEYRMVNPEVGKKYFQKFEYSTPPKDIFLKEKPDSCFRIFVMGSSTVVGFPYDNNLMFSRILHERLREAYPARKIEVVNTAITAINSFTLLDFMPQILKEKPDAVFFYAGHNEFYGAFGVGSNEAVTHNAGLINLHLKCMNSRVYQLTRNIISGISGVFSKRNTASEKRGTLMTRIVKNADITYDSKEYSEGMKYYERNLDLIMAMAKQKNVPFFLSDWFQISRILNL
jgi:lysophospholipase L1-like esterase